MDTRTSKLEKLEKGVCRQLSIQETKQPLDDWILENQENVELSRAWCLGLIHRLHRESPDDNKYYGLRSVKMEEEAGDDAEAARSGRCCPICIKDFKKNSQAIRMPCSHIFHGFCIFQWLGMMPTCPLCRFELFSSTPREGIS